MSWWHRLRHRQEMEDRLDQELRFHLEQHMADLVAAGHDPAEARRLARRTIGGPEQVKERCRDARGTRWLEDLWHDLRFALRTLRQRPGFAVIAILTLALGSGATTVMFTVIHGVLFKPLPFYEPDRLVRVQEQTSWSTQWGSLWAFTYPNYVDCKRESHSVAMAAWRDTSGTVSEPGEAESVDGRQVSSDLLAVLGVRLVRGRGFLASEDRPGTAPVAMISYGFWQRRFAGSPSAIGMRLVFDGKPYTITGILPEGFRLGDEADIFTPLGQETAPFLLNREAHPGIRVWARLQPGATLAGAQAELTAVGRGLAEQYPKSNRGRTFFVDPLRPDVGDVRSTLWLLLGAVSLVLLIVCVNVASLLLARAVSRERELAMRVALGAGRSRLARQCLTESAVLALCGGAAGVLLAAMGLRPFVAFWPGSLPRAEEVHLDWQVLLFALGLSLVTGLAFGIAPALRAPVQNLESALRAGGRTLAGRSRRLHSGLVVSEIALAVVLLVAAGMLGRTVLRLSALSPGLRVRNVLTARIGLSPVTLAQTGKIRAAWQDVLDRARAVPGVESVAIVDTVPMREGNNQIGYRTTPASPPAEKLPLALATSVTPDYLKVMGLRLLEGRFFDDQDRLGSQSVVVIDDVMARQAFGREEPVGKHLWVDLGGDPATVVGVVGHVRYWGLASDDRAAVRAELYYPFAQVPDRFLRRWSELMSIAAGTGIPPMQLVEPLRRAVRTSSNDQVLYEVHTLEELASESLARQRFLLLLFGIFAGLSLLLASIGIYGVLAYLTGQRVPEIGVRMALGASAGEVMWMVLRQSLGMILIGALAGTAASLAAARILQRLVEGMQPGVLSTIAPMIGVLMAAGLIASFLPARRASRVDPVRALRQE